MRLSIILISWNSKNFLDACLSSLEDMCRADVEIIWVDNGSTDGAYEMVRDKYKHVKAFRLNANKGVAYARNVGMRHAVGEYVLILDDDTVADAEAINQMVDYMDNNPNVGICGPALRSSEGELQPSFKDYPGIRAKISNIFNGLVGRRQAVVLPNEIVHPCYIIGACQLIRRAVLDKVGLLDEKIFYGPEDADLCIRIRNAGYQVSYLPHISILHHWQRITNRNLFSRISYLHFRALLHLYHKHHRYF